MIEVTGEGSVDVTPDFARVTLGVTSTAKDARDAMAANAKSLAAVVAAIKGEGVGPLDIQTSSVSISPNFANNPPSTPGARAITGYTASNMATVTVRDISRLGELLDKAVDAGANAMYGIGYGENDPSSLLDKARPLAIADARRKADIYAKAAGAEVGRLVSLSEEGGGGFAPMATTRVYAQAAVAPTPIEPGQDRLTVRINAQFELKP